ncbi:MAG TPA: hypothetical protein VFD69_07300 [Vicinamibacterales bacterium]|nr:hypothetical protein [Vicinamibacterales bacterium]
MSNSPLLDTFKRGEVNRELKLLAAQAVVAPRADEQLELLVMLAGDADPEIAATAERTLAAIPPAQLAATLGSVSAEVKARFVAKGIQPADTATAVDAPLIDASPEVEEAPADEETQSALQRISNMNVAMRIALAMRGNREERAILIRDPNRIVTAAVLSSPKMNDTEVAAIAKMQNVSEDVLRTIAKNRAWLKNYSVVLAVVKNPKTPVALSMNLMARLGEKDLKLLTTDRNVPDVLRMQARRKMVGADK